MTRYNYILKNGKMERSIKESFPNISAIDKGISVQRNVETIRKTAIKAVQGELEQPWINIEEEWYDTYLLLQESQEKLYNLNSKLEYLNSKLTSTPKYRHDILKDTENKILKTKDEIKETEEYTHIIKLKIQDFESKNEWLLLYRGIETDVQRPEITGEIVLYDEIVQKLIKYEIEKMNENKSVYTHDMYIHSLLATYIKDLYNSLPADQKPKMSNDIGILDMLSSDIDLTDDEIRNIIENKKDIISIIKKYK